MELSKDLFKEYIEAAIKSDASAKFTYTGIADPCNSEYVRVNLNGTPLVTLPLHGISRFNETLKELSNEIGVRYAEKRIELHFAFHGFNSCMHETLIIEISPSAQTKRGIVKANYDMLGYNSVVSILDEYPTYELYLRCGLGYRGSKEERSDREKILRAVGYAAVSSVKIIDDEIHVNTYSYSDME